MSKCYINNNFFEFVIAKHIPFETLEEDFANFAGEDSFNSEVAEAALELSFDLYPDDQVGKDNDDLMDLRHEFVDEFLEYARCEVIKKWAGNLGMFTKEEVKARINDQVQISKEYWTNKFKKMSSYQFSAWKLGVPADDKEQDRIMEQVEDSVFYDAKYPDEEREVIISTVAEGQKTIRVPQDSEDECWEQMRAMNNHHQDI